MYSKRPSILLMAEALTPRHCFPTFNFDRLETLGDAFLKYDCCTHVYFAYPKAHEGSSSNSSHFLSMLAEYKHRKWKK